MPRKPTRVFRGLRRALLNKLNNALASIVAMDVRTSKFFANGTTPIQFFNVGGSGGVAGAITQLQNRIAACLTATA